MNPVPSIMQTGARLSRAAAGEPMPLALEARLTMVDPFRLQDFHLPNANILPAAALESRAPSQS